MSDHDGATPSVLFRNNSGILPGTYLIGGPLGLSGGCLRYFDRLLQTSAVEHEHGISRLPPGSDGLLIFPGLTGERSPYWKSYLTGSITGLTPDHNREHILRAVKEGCALRLVKLLDILTKNGLQPHMLNVAGGGADSDAWNQIRADATGLVVQKMAVAEATCLGTAIFCQTAVDKTRSLKEISGEWIKVAKRFKPLPEHTAAYQRFSRLFETYVESNSVLFQELDECRRQVDSDKKL